MILHSLSFELISLAHLSYQMSFEGKVVLITGASSGIRAETATHFVQLDASLSLTGRNKQNLEKTAEQCGQSKTFIVTGELTNEKDLKNIIDSTIKHYGKLDILVNNAGIMEIDNIETASLEQYDNLSGIRSHPNNLIYCMTTLDQFTRCVALELGPKQVPVNSMNPDIIVTNLLWSLKVSDEEIKNFIKNCKRTHPLGKTGEVSEVAKSITFLASDDASFITGVTLSVNGDRHATCY